MITWVWTRAYFSARPPVFPSTPACRPRMDARQERTDDRPGRARSMSQFAGLPEPRAAFLFFPAAESILSKRAPNRFRGSRSVQAKRSSQTGRRHNPVPALLKPSSSSTGSAFAQPACQCASSEVKPSERPRRWPSQAARGRKHGIDRRAERRTGRCLRTRRSHVWPAMREARVRRVARLRARLGGR